MDPKTRPSDIPPDVRRAMASKTRRSFLVGGIAGLAGLGAFRWIATRSQEGELQWPLRKSLEFDESATMAYFSPARLAREFPPGTGSMPIVNGDLGLGGGGMQPMHWSLEVSGLRTPGGTASLSMADIYALPKVDFVTELKCVEGWSRRVHWGGARLRDFAQRYQAAYTGKNDYVGLRTPDGEYYVGLDMQTALHPQTLLCYEMDGRPLEPGHGAPLRLTVPLKYGIKNLKRIGEIAFTSERPPDYWAERGYDYYAGF
jgi:DMSO/TMAO reductase YedYZ molybdopterin-dependent catalytic subunit